MVLVPRNTDDIRHAYKLIRIDDTVECITIRKVVKKTKGTNSSTSKRIRMVLRIKVKSMEADTVGGVLRVLGQITNPNPYVKVRLTVSNQYRAK